MPEVQLRFSNNYVDDLEERLQSSSVQDLKEEYASPEFLPDPRAVLRTGIELSGPAPTLLEADHTTAAKHDAKNAKLVHRYIGPIHEEQAGDRRLWTYLTHVVFRDYVRARYKPDAGRHTVTNLRKRWFYRSARQGLHENAVARLWWAAQLTHAPWKRDSEYFADLRAAGIGEYDFTDLLFSNQNVFQGIVSRRLGGNLRVRIALLEALRRKRGDFSDLSQVADLTQQRVNLELAYRVLSPLPFHAVVQIMTEHVVGAIAELERRNSL